MEKKEFNWEDEKSVFRSLHCYDKELIDETWKKLNMPLNYWSTQSVFTTMPTLNEMDEHLSKFHSLYPPLVPLTNDEKSIELTEEEALKWACNEVKNPPPICVMFTMKHKKAPLACYKPVLPDTTPSTIPKLIHPPKIQKFDGNPIDVVDAYLKNLISESENKDIDILKLKTIKSKAFYVALLKCLKQADSNILSFLGKIKLGNISYTLNTPDKILDFMDSCTDFLLVDSRKSFSSFLKVVEAFLKKNETSVTFGRSVSKSGTEDDKDSQECGSVVIQTLGHECDILLITIDDVDYAIDCLELDAELAVNSAMPNGVIPRLLSNQNILKVICGSVRTSYDIKKRLKLSTLHITPVFYPATTLSYTRRIGDMFSYLYGIDTLMNSHHKKRTARDSVLKTEPLNINFTAGSKNQKQNEIQPIKPIQRNRKQLESQALWGFSCGNANGISGNLNKTDRMVSNKNISGVMQLSSGLSNINHFNSNVDSLEDSSSGLTSSGSLPSSNINKRFTNRQTQDDQPRSDHIELSSSNGIQQSMESELQDDLITMNYKAESSWANRPIDLVALHKIRKQAFLLMSEAWKDVWALCQNSSSSQHRQKILGGLGNTTNVSCGISAFSYKLNKSESSAFSLPNNSPKASNTKLSGFTRPPLASVPTQNTKVRRSSSTSNFDQKSNFLQRLGSGYQGLSSYYNEAKEIARESNVPIECVISDRLLLFCKQNDIEFPPPLEVVVAIEGKNRAYPPFLLAKMASLSNSVPNVPLSSQFGSLEELYKYMGWGRHRKDTQGSATISDGFTSVCKGEINSTYESQKVERYGRNDLQSRSIFNQSPYRFSPINLMPSAKFGLRPSSRERNQYQFDFNFASPITKTPVAHKNSPPSPVRTEEEIYPQTPTAIQQAAELSRATKKKQNKV